MSAKSKKVPMRMCLGCREMKPKRDLIRIVIPKEGDAQIDPTGKTNGRGAYLCKNADCLQALGKQKGNRLPAAIMEGLKKQIEE